MTEIFHGSPQSLHENAGITGATTTSFHILTNSFILLSLNAICSELLTASLNKTQINTNMSGL
jgi:hypothetical protein